MKLRVMCVCDKESCRFYPQAKRSFWSGWKHIIQTSDKSYELYDDARRKEMYYFSNHSDAATRCCEYSTAIARTDENKTTITYTDVSND